MIGLSSHLSGSGSITKLQRMVQVERETGDIRLYTMDDPEVTGIDWKAVNWDQVRKDQEGYNG